ncbi:Uncharacterised protein [Vibrio alginolyticus]|jgi:hypothetical protein|nr:hypothetical protein XM68_c20343 [Vibrio alginolyticus]SQA42264.1 Uncharacterised protein [Vibrio alginolyticus]
MRLLNMNLAVQFSKVYSVKKSGFTPEQIKAACQ